MSEPARGELKVAIFGSSVTALVCGERGGDAVFRTYPRVVADTVVDGTSFAVSASSHIYGMITDCSRIWAEPLAQTRPDIVVLQFGMGETFPRVVPKALISHLLGVGRHAGPIRDAYWKFARRLLLTIHALERRVDAHLPVQWCRVSPQRFERELALVTRKISEQVGSRVVVMTSYEPLAPTPFLNRRMLARVAAVNAGLARVAERQGLEIFPLGDIVTRRGGSCLPDGLHMNVDTHKAVGDALARQLVRASATRAA